MAGTGTPVGIAATVGWRPDDVIQYCVGAMSGAPEYTISTAGPGTVVFTRRYTPTWAIVLGVLGIFLFLIGILFFFVKTTETVTVVAHPSPSGSYVTVQGVAPAYVAARLQAVVNSALIPG